MLMSSQRQRLTVYRQMQNDYLRTTAYSSRSKDLSVHARIDPTGYIRLLWESSEEDDELTHAAILEVKFGKQNQMELSQILESEQLIHLSLTLGLLH